MSLQRSIGLFCALVATAGTGLSQKPPREKKQNKEPNIYQKYQRCKSDSLQKFKKPNQRKKLKKALKQCKERIPQAVEYENCKKEAIRKNLSAPSVARKLVRECRAVMIAQTFKTKEKLPLDRVKDQLFFAGLRLDQTLSLSDLNKKAKGFDCELVREALKGAHPPEYLLFGNRIRSFWTEKNVKAHAEKTKKIVANAEWDQDNKDNEYADIARVGRIYRSKKDISLFFPTAYCSYQRSTGRIYEGIKVYYLIDRKNQKAFPYFGLSFYKSSKKIQDEDSIVQELRKELGDSFREFRSQRGAIYLVEDEIAEFDSEDDPYDICKAPRKHRTIGVIKKRKATDSNSMLMIVANIKNLCHFGDKRVQGRLSGKKSKKQK